MLNDLRRQKLKMDRISCKVTYKHSASSNERSFDSFGFEHQVSRQRYSRFTSLPPKVYSEVVKPMLISQVLYLTPDKFT